MLYRPKFCSPAWTAEQKCFKYDNKNQRYTFSCVCDGNEIIDKAELKIFDVNYYLSNPEYRELDRLRCKGEENEYPYQAASTIFSLTENSTGLSLKWNSSGVYFFDNLSFNALKADTNSSISVKLREIIFCNSTNTETNVIINKIIFKEKQYPEIKLTKQSNSAEEIDVSKFKISGIITLSKENVVNDYSFVKDSDVMDNSNVVLLFEYPLTFTLQPQDLNIYPTDERGQYNLIEYTWEAPEKFTGEFYWQINLYDKYGNITSSPKEKTGILLTNNNFNFYKLKTEANKNTYRVFQEEKVNLDYPIQYWYYSIQSNNKNIYTSKKFFTPKIGFTYDNLVNGNTYMIQIIIVDVLNNQVVLEKEYDCNYTISNSTANFKAQSLMYNSGILLNWNNLIIGEAESLRGTAPLRSFDFKQNETTYSNQTYYFQGIKDKLSLVNLDAQAHGFYGCFRLEDSGNLSIDISYLLNKEKETITFSQEYNEETKQWNLLFNQEKKLENITLGSWYIFYYRSTDSKCFVKAISPKTNLPIAGISTVETTLISAVEYDENTNKIEDSISNNNISYVYNDIICSGEKAELAYLFILNDTKDSGKIYAELSNINYKPYWGKGLCNLADNLTLKNDQPLSFLVSLNFETNEPDEKTKNPLIIGDIAVVDTVSSAQIKRLDDNAQMLTIANIPNILDMSNLQLIDLSAVSNKNYEYYLYLRNDKDEYVTAITTEDIVSALWDRWVLYICDETDTENIYTLDKAYLFGLNLSSGSMKNNNKKTIIENFTPYPRVQSSCSNYWSGKLSGLLGYIDSDLMTYVQTPEILNDLKMLSFNTKKKFLKDRDGNLFEVELSNSIDVGNTDNLTIDLKTKTIEWVEVGDTSNVSIVIIEQGKIKNAIENKEIMG
jgi:hypothetical protein